LAQFYTVREANAMLPELTRLIQAMQLQGQQLAAMQGRVAAMQKKVRGNGYHNPTEDIMLSQAANQTEEALRLGVEQLAKWNIELKDLQRGLVDFPARREGRIVFLCWELGEPEVGYWHETTSGYDTRQPLDDQFA
jgi:hypothetical protein